MNDVSFKKFSIFKKIAYKKSHTILTFSKQMCFLLASPPTSSPFIHKFPLASPHSASFPFIQNTNI